jgi:hypothetical protein
MVSFRRPAGVFTTKDPRHQGKNHREVREVKEEKTFSPQRHRGHKGEKMQATSAKDTEERGLWFVDYPSLL